MEPFQRLEAKIGKWMGYEAQNVVACSSGTAALHLALESLQLPPASKVIVPDYCMIACARAVTLAGLEPVFVDCGDDLNIDANKVLPASFNHDVRAVLAVHTYGRRCDMDTIHGTARKFNLRVIEDMAEIHGVKPHPETDAACWSFYKNKIVAGEEGGAVAFPDEGTNPSAKLARQLRSLGFTDTHDFYHVPRGHNYRMSNLHAAPILRVLTQTNMVEAMRLRREIEGWYDECCPNEWKMPKRDVVWVYDFKLPEHDARGTWVDRVVRALNEAGIAARQGFKPMTEQREYASSKYNRKAVEMGQRIAYMPVQPGVTTRDDCRRAFEVARQVVEGV